MQKSTRKVRFALSVTLGAIFGVLVRKFVPSVRRHVEEAIELYITPEQISQIVFEGGGHVRYDTLAGQVNVFVMDDPETV